MHDVPSRNQPILAETSVARLLQHSAGASCRVAPSARVPVPATRLGAASKLIHLCTACAFSFRSIPNATRSFGRPPGEFESAGGRVAFGATDAHVKKGWSKKPNDGPKRQWQPRGENFSAKTLKKLADRQNPVYLDANAW